MYDSEFDILTLKYASNDNATAREFGSNILVYTHDITGEVTTITVMDFVQKFEELLPSLQKIPLVLDFEEVLHRVA